MNLAFTNDKEFIEILTEVVEANLGDENFGVKELVHKTGINRASLNRKLHVICQKSISQFIREIRLQRSMELLQQGSATASEVAYKVGFGSPTYFNTCFHEYFGYPPGEVKRKDFPIKEESSELLSEGAIMSKELSEEVKELPVSGKKAGRKFIFLMISVIVVLLAIAWLYFNKIPSASKELSIVVLPFKNLSDDPNNQYIVDGLMEDILNNLYQISDLRVISRTTSEYFRDKNLPTNEIARMVNAHNVLEGSIRIYDDKLRISVQLIDATRDQHLWSQNFDRDSGDIIGIQGDIALQVANKLNAVLSDNNIRQIVKIPTQNPEAYDNYLMGRFLLNKSNTESRTDINKESLLASLPYFEKAIAADTTFADAYAGLAKVYLSLSGWGWIPQKEGFQKTKDLSLKALQINPECVEAHAVKGSCHIWGERRFEDGRKELLTALQLNPNYPPAYQYYAQLLMITGPIEEARIYLDRALEFESYFWVLQNLNAWIYYFEEKHEKAIEACTAAHDLYPDFIENNWLFFLNYAKLGEGEKAMAELQIIARTHPASAQFTNEIKDAFSRSGIEGLFTWLIYVNMNKPVPVAGMTGHPYFIAWWYAILGNREESIYWLEKNMEARYRMYEYFNLIATNPDFDILRNDPRFLKIIDETGLTPYNTRKAKIN